MVNDDVRTLLVHVQQVVKGSRVVVEQARKAAEQARDKARQHQGEAKKSSVSERV